jgi:hypothetical protein
VLTVQITKSGTFAVRSPNPPPGTGADLAIGASIGGRITGIVLPAAGLVLTGTGSAIALFIVRTALILRRSRPSVAGTWARPPTAST